MIYTILDSSNGMRPKLRGLGQAVSVGADEDGSEFATHGGAMTNSACATLVFSSECECNRTKECRTVANLETTQKNLQRYAVFSNTNALARLEGWVVYVQNDAW
jgi:hypothetical protein